MSSPYIKLGLQRIERLLSYTPAIWPPKFKAVHIAGTNGKGSTAAYLSRFLYEAYNGKKKIGRFTSPHLIDRWDCIEINGQTVDKAVFDDAEQASLAAMTADKRAPEAGGRPSNFELLTHTAFGVFAREKVDLAVIEVGVGGLEDATNILRPQDVACSVITKISIDHTELLGNTRRAITLHKAGIIKRGVPVVITQQIAEVSDLIEKIGTARLAKEIVFSNALSDEYRNVLFHFARKHKMAEMQIENIKTATAALVVMSQDQEFEKPVKEILQSISDIQWPGRLQSLSIESITGYPHKILLDGAHNQSAATNLAIHVRRIWAKKRHNSFSRVIRYDNAAEQPVTWVIAASKGKDLYGILRPLLRSGDRVIATTFGPVDGMPWVKCEEPEVIVDTAASILGRVRDTKNGKYPGLHAYPGLYNALRKAGYDSHHGPMVVTGSLYLVGDVLRMKRESEQRPKVYKDTRDEVLKSVEDTFQGVAEQPS